MKFGRRRSTIAEDEEVRPPEPGTREAGSGRRILRDIGILIGIFAVGFGIAFIWLSPGPLVSADHATPDVIGMPGDQAELLLTKAGFKTKRGDSRQHPTYQQGTVIWQDPAGGTILPTGTPVTLTVSDGIAPYAVPDVSNLPLELAANIIEAAGFRMSKVDTAKAAGPPGVVVEVRPAIGSVQPAGTSIQLVISSSRPAQPPPQEARP